MKMIISMIFGGLLWMVPAQAMETKKAESLAAVKEPAPNMRKLTILGFIKFAYVAPKKSPAVQVAKNSDIKTSKKLTEKQKKAQEQYPTLDAYYKEQDEMSTCLQKPDQRKVKYAPAGSILDM